MEQIYNEQGQALNMSLIDFLSDDGSEFTVYKYLSSVIKLYKKDYPLTHLSLEELYVLKKIITQRILLPSGLLWNGNCELVGYEMPFIGGEKDLEQDNTGEVLDELEVLRKDIELLSRNLIILRDLNKSNKIYNGKLYLIDPGNYLVGEIERIILHTNIDPLLAEELKKIILFGDDKDLKSLTDSLSREEKQRIVREWNYDKINKLLNALLFSGSNNIDPFKYRQIVQFLMQEGEKNRLQYNLDLFKQYFDRNRTVKEAREDFIEKHIKENPKEKQLFMSLYNK